MTGRSKKYQDETIEQEEINEGLDSVSVDGTEYENDPSENTSDERSGETSENTENSKLCEDNISKLEQEIFEYRDKLIRKAAEFENYKKRTSDEFIRLIDTANEDLIVRLIPVLDDIERFQKNYSDGIKTEDLKKGVDMIFDKFINTLKNFGVEEIESINTEFDPGFHDALLMIEKDGFDSNIVVDQHEKGYKLKDKVIRHAKVVVSK